MLAVSLALTPQIHDIYARAGMLSADGRCKTFDARANGYARGEGVGAITLCEWVMGVVLLGCAVRADGRSASLTAPNGVAQMLLIGAALASASTDRLQLLEAHGTGTALGDPTEAGGLGRVLGMASPSVSGVKGNLGHAEPAAGLAGLLVLVHSSVQRTSVNAQLRVLNVLLVPPLRGLDASVSTQGLMLTYAAAGVSSFGYSGTIAHAVLRHAGGVGVLSVMEAPLAYQRRSFSWRIPLHPFVQRPFPSSGSSVVFRSPAAGALHTVVCNHVVQGRIIFPGAGYLEVARAAGASALHGVYFLQPLAAEAPGLLIECALSNAHVEVRTSETEAFEGATVHCSGATASDTVWQRVDHASLRTLSRVADVRALYDGFDAVGLQYGPGYRTLINVWGSAIDALALLHARSTLEHTQVHPASLDDALCTSAAMASSGGGGTRLPFAVDEALLQSAPGEMWAVRSRSHQALSTAPCA
jgi:acyl transferase domain-containing protein